MTYFLIEDSLGGAEQLVMRLAEFDKLNSKICFFKKQSTDIWIKQGFNVVYCDGNFLNFFSFCRNNNFNMVFSSHLMMNSILGLLRNLRIIKTEKLICRESTIIFDRYKGLKLLKYKIAYFIGYRKIDLLITQTDEMRSKLIIEIPFLNKLNIRTIPNLFEFPKHQIFALKSTEPYIVSAGRFIEEKGFDILFEAFKKVKNYKPKLKLIVLGEGNLRSSYENQISYLGLNNDVLLPGFVDDVYPYFKGAELCVVSSRIEGFPNVLLQMMSQNDKVVSTLCAGGIEKIPGIFKAPAKDVDALTKVILEGLENDTKNNRIIFDKLLSERSIENFIETIDKYLSIDN